MKNTAWITGLKRFGLVTAAIVIISSGWVGWKVYAAVSKTTGNKNPLQLLSVFRSTQLKQSNGRVNVLVAGYSVDDPGHEGADLTDSIMVLSIDQTTKKAVAVSVPRDLWVDIPGFGYQKDKCRLRRRRYDAAGASRGAGLRDYNRLLFADRLHSR